MPDAKFQPVSHYVSSQWEARRGSLERSLSTSPDSQCSWLWRIRLRICTYLLRRYGSVAPRQDDRSRTQLPESPGSFAVTTPTRPVIPLLEIQRRTQIRDRQHPALERLAGVGDDTRERTAAIVRREKAKQSRCEAIWDPIAHVSLRILQAVAALLVVAVLAAVAVTYPVPYMAIVFVTSSALAVTWWTSLRSPRG